MTDEINLTPTRPYMVRAIYQWLEDNELTPYLMADATHKGTRVPTEHVQEGRIVLNIGSRATGNMVMDNNFINFNARFGGVFQEIWIPMQAVMGIYSKENSQGMFFDPNEYDNYTPKDTEQSKDDNQSTNEAKKPRPKRENTAGLKILK